MVNKVPTNHRPNVIHRTPYECEITRSMGFAFCPVYQIDGTMVYGYVKWARSRSKYIKGKRVYYPKYWIAVKPRVQGNGQSDGF